MARTSFLGFVRQSLRSSRCQRRRRGRASLRRGKITVLIAVLIVPLLGFVALAVDTGYIANVKAELKRATDAGALAGAGALSEGPAVARAQVLSYLAQNQVGGRTVGASDVDITLGHWNTQSRQFQASDELPSAIRVSAAIEDQPLFFARVLGHDDFSLREESIAMYQPRDIMLVLDYSASMNDDSELAAQSKAGITKASVEANLLQIYQDLGSPKYGSMKWDQTLSSSASTSSVKTSLGISSTPYPFPSGSWNDYIAYVKKSSSNLLPSAYQHHYGYMTFMNYLLEKQPGVTQTPVLWKASAQPITALKNSVTVFLAFLQEVDTDDRLGLSVYTAADGTAKLEAGLTRNFSSIETISRQRQAGHYDQYTNIGAGMQKARQELQSNARVGAFKMMVLMTDGVANRPTNTTQARNLVLSEANLAAAARIPIVTISLGAGADTALMQQVADITKGYHFNVPGGRPVSEMEEDMKNAFREIANDRPLKLVK